MSIVICKSCGYYLESKYSTAGFCTLKDKYKAEWDGCNYHSGNFVEEEVELVSKDWLVADVSKLSKDDLINLVYKLREAYCRKPTDVEIAILKSVAVAAEDYLKTPDFWERENLQLQIRLWRKNFDLK